MFDPFPFLRIDGTEERAEDCFEKAAEDFEYLLLVFSSSNDLSIWLFLSFNSLAL
jgi:hypothetical protein